VTKVGPSPTNAPQRRLREKDDQQQHLGDGQGWAPAEAGRGRRSAQVSGIEAGETTLPPLESIWEEVTPMTKREKRHGGKKHRGGRKGR
jgi:hypothetical protein